MATILSAPAEGSLLNDANITEILLSDTGSFDYYSADLALDGVFYDTILLPRFSAHEMLLQFSHLLKGLPFPAVTSYIIQPYSLIKGLSILIYKHVGTSKTLTHTFSYNVMYATLPFKLDFLWKQLEWAGIDFDAFSCSRNGEFKLPIYVKSKTAVILIELVSDAGVFFSQTAVNPGSGFMLLHLFLTIPETVSSFLVRVTVGTYSITKKAHVVDHGLYSPKKVLFRNRFGLPILLELFGRSGIEDNYTFYSYKNSMNAYLSADVDVENEINIDTGYLLNSERNVVHQICTSLDIGVFVNDEYMPCVVTTKSVQVFLEKEFLMSQQLSFKMNRYPLIKN